ncbi:MAG: hypothetical protein L0177_13430 [Chloroflexi bacterium]|nr:hypothetical protein [Chloroflexota bacterium]
MVTAALERLDGACKVMRVSPSRYAITVRQDRFLAPADARRALAGARYPLHNLLVKAPVVVAEEGGLLTFTLGGATRVIIKNGDDSLKRLKRLIADGKTSVELQGALAEKRDEKDQPTYSLTLTGVKPLTEE